MVRTCVSRRIIRSADILGSMPLEQCLAVALFSSDCIAKGGNIPVDSYSNQKQKQKQLKTTVKNKRN